MKKVYILQLDEPAQLRFVGAFSTAAKAWAWADAKDADARWVLSPWRMDNPAEIEHFDDEELPCSTG